MPLAQQRHRVRRLAPDQRAAVSSSFGRAAPTVELADLLGMPEETIRARAPQRPVRPRARTCCRPGARRREIADWLLGQQSEAHAARTARAACLADPAAQKWAATVAEPLRAAPGGGADARFADRHRERRAARRPGTCARVVTDSGADGGRPKVVDGRATARRDVAPDARTAAVHDVTATTPVP